MTTTEIIAKPPEFDRGCYPHLYYIWHRSLLHTVRYLQDSEHILLHLGAASFYM